MPIVTIRLVFQNQVTYDNLYQRQKFCQVNPVSANMLVCKKQRQRMAVKSGGAN